LFNLLENIMAKQKTGKTETSARVIKQTLTKSALINLIAEQNDHCPHLSRLRCRFVGRIPCSRSFIQRAIASALKRHSEPTRKAGSCPAFSRR
jgi:hypothetical protein